ncbi:MAG: PAS domain S-box protein [Anaerolineae bacterium]
MEKREQELTQTADVDHMDLLMQQLAELEEVQAANTLLRTLLDTMPVGVSVCNAQGEILMTNPRGSVILGELPRGSVIHPSRTYTLCNPDGMPLPAPETPLARAMTQGETVPWTEILLCRADGSRRTLLAAAAPVMGEGGQIVSGVSVFQDITERKHLEMTLEIEHNKAENERRRLKAMMEALPVGVAITNLRGGTIQSNKAYEEMWGESRPATHSVKDYAAYQAWWVDTGKPIQPEEWASAQVVRTGHSVIGQVLEIERFDGSRAFVINSAAPVRAASGEIVGSAVVIQDITDLHSTELALRESEARYQELFDTSRDGIVVTDMEGCYLQCNPAYLDLLGYETFEEIRGKSYADFTPPEYYEMESRIIREQTLVRGYCDEYEKEYVRKNGERIPVSLKAWLRRDSNGQPVGMWVIVRDITEQVQAREVLQNYTEELERQTKRRASALRASHARFRAIFEDGAIGIALVDQSAHVIAGNPALQRILGYSKEELEGMSLAAFTHPESTGDDLKLYNELIAGERRYYQMEGRYVRKDGRPIDVNITVSLVQWQNEGVRYAVVMLEDISARKETQEALFQSEKLALTGKLAASLAHEINNPLQSVVGFLSLLEESLAGDGEIGKEEARSYVRIAIEEVKRAAGLVHQMRNLNRPSEPEDREPSDVNALVERVVALSHKKSQEQHVQIIWEAADTLPLIPAVPDRIQQVFLNLTLNALEAMPEGGELRISTARTISPDGVKIRFADSGVGIAFADISKLFKPFHTSKATGMGLGLYISQRIVREHSGRIDVDSVPGKGATFTVWLPVQPGEMGSS